ncbi:e3 sumo- ligase 2 [Pyrrhoderma noxium]|uniref:E3 sumo-ligase 2 n=1 Tax=Pyrrhoderma noxium TaxID=2282107 RepID=A0A286UJG6_9AGAM|nr:e3 sumo- ligase 2 [Pyrrhoderma noxium]
MKFSKSFDRKINRNDNSSPYRRSKSPKSGPQSPQRSTEKPWSVTGFFKFLRNITASITSNDRENELPRYRTDSHITPSSSGSSSAAVEVLLNENKNQSQHRNTFSNSTSRTQPQVQTEVPQPQQEVNIVTPARSDSTPSASPEAIPAEASSIRNNDGNNTNTTLNTADRILEWAMKKVVEGRPVNDIEVIGLRAVLHGQKSRREAQAQAEFYEPEKMNLASEATSSRRTPTFSLNNTLPTFTSNELGRSVEQQQPKKRRMLKRDPNGALYWRGAGTARVRPVGTSHLRQQQQRASTSQLQGAESSKRRRVVEEEIRVPTPSIASTSSLTHVESSSVDESGLLGRQGGMPMPERILRPTVVRPRTTPAVSSPLRNVVNGSSSSSGSATTSNGKGVASKGFAVNLMEQVIKNNTPEKKPDVGNPYQAAAPVKLGVQSSARVKLAGKKREREPSVENAAGSSDGKKEKEKERMLSAKDIIEATVPKGAKRSRPTPSDLKKSRVNGEFTPNPGFGAGVGSPFSLISHAIIEEPEDEEGSRAKRQKKTGRSVTIEEIDDDGNIISSTSSKGFGKPTKTSSPFVTPSEIIEPKEDSSPAWSSTKHSTSTNGANVNGSNNLKMTNGILGKTSNLPREPSKLRKSFVAEDENENVEVKRVEKKKGVSTTPLFVPPFTSASAKTSTNTSHFGASSLFGTADDFENVYPRSRNTPPSSMTLQSKPLGVIQEKGDVKEYVRQLSLIELPRYVFCRPDPGCVVFPGRSILGTREMDRLKNNIMEMPERKLPRFGLDYKVKRSAGVSKLNGSATNKAIGGFSATSTSAPASAPSVGFNWAKAGMKPPSDPTKEGKWVCGECTLTNDDTKAVKCAYCDARRPEPKVTSSSSSSSSVTGSMSTPSTGFDWAKAGMKPPTDPTKEGKWVCGECTLTNDDTKAVKCAYCDSRRPDPKAITSSSSSATVSTTLVPTAGFDWAKAGMKPPTDPTKEGKWVCDECTLVNDDIKAVKCAYCDARRPEGKTNTSSTTANVSSSTGFDWAKAGMRPPTDPTKEGKWICGECTLVNDDTKAVKCIYCDSRR